MLFHATHKHSYQTCHAHDEEKKAKVMEALKGAADIEIKVRGYTSTLLGTHFILFLRRTRWSRSLSSLTQCTNSETLPSDR